MKNNIKFLSIKLMTIGLCLGLLVAGFERIQTAHSLSNAMNGQENSNLAPLVCPGAGLLISEVFTNPSGNDSPFEFVELRATRPINFATTPYSVVFTNNGTATANGWIQGSAISYGFSIASGSVNTGDVVYVGGSSMIATGPKLRTIDTGTTNGDGFGSPAAGGVLGNGGASADSVAVFDVAIASLTSSTVPVDAIFFGTGAGSAVVSGGAAGYQLPVNDTYAGGKLQTASFIAPDVGNNFLVATGTFSTETCAFTANRTWTDSPTFTDNTSNIMLTIAGAPTITENTATPFISLPATSGGALSGVIGDSTDPARTLGVDFTIADSNTPVNSLVVTATSTDELVVPVANLIITGSGANRNLKIIPNSVGYTTISVNVTDGTTLVSYIINYAASNPAIVNPSTRWHTGKADASTAIAVDSNYMFIADDEDQRLRFFDRNKSGFSIANFDMTPNLALTDISNGVPREVDIEASVQIANRIYWLASHSNSSTGVNRPNRSRLFATDITNAGVASTLAYVGRYDNLKADLINWDSSNGHGLGANYFGLAASASVSVIPEETDGSGFNIEGLTVAPNGTTGYISFRAPIVPAITRTDALIVPVTNLAALVSGNPSAGPATFGAPIQLDLGGRGIREIKKNSANEYLIVAGTAGGPADFALYSWTGNPANTPIKRTASLTGLNPEAIVDVPVGLNAPAPGSFINAQIVSDNGDDIYYGDGVAAKDLPNTEHKKFRSDIVNIFAFGAKTFFDFDGDGQADVSVYRPETGVWYLRQSANGLSSKVFGQSGDKIVPADYDGDGRTDVAVYRSGVWYLQRSQEGFRGVTFGAADDVPVPADYDGDGKADIAVFRPSNGTWYILRSTAGIIGIQLGSATDKPVPGDYDGNGTADVAVFRPSNGTWYTSTNPATNYGAMPFGTSEDKPVPADFDGDGKTDLAVFRPSNGTWYLKRSAAGNTAISFGLGTDKPVPADYDGDGKADIAVIRNGTWYLNRSTQGLAAILFGISTDLPTPNVFIR